MTVKGQSCAGSAKFWLAVALACASVSFAGRAAADTAAANVNSQLSVVVPAVVLRDEQGRGLSLPAELDRPGPVYLNFIFTSCGAVCPVMTAIFARLDRQLHAPERTARLYSISIDPLEDTSARLHAYAAEHGASPHWHFLTGTPAASEQVQRAFGVWRADRMSHPVATFFRATPGGSWTRVDGFASAEALLAQLRTTTHQ